MRVWKKRGGGREIEREGGERERGGGRERERGRERLESKDRDDIVDAIILLISDSSVQQQSLSIVDSTRFLAISRLVLTGQRRENLRRI